MFTYNYTLLISSDSIFKNELGINIYAGVSILSEYKRNPLK